MPKTSHQHFSVALLSKVNDKIDLKQKFEKQVVSPFSNTYLRKKQTEF